MLLGRKSDKLDPYRDHRFIIRISPDVECYPTLIRVYNTFALSLLKTLRELRDEKSVIENSAALFKCDKY